MSESDAESSGGDDMGPLFPVDGKFRSQQDKQEILAMPEIEREALLAERAAQMERQQQDVILRRLYKGYKDKEEAKAAKKRKAGVASLEEGERKSSRQRTTLAGRRVGETSAPLEAYKAQRERKDLQDQQRRADAVAGRGGRKRDSRSPQSEGEVEGESEPEWDGGRTKDDLPSQADEAPDHAEYNRIRVGRQNFALVCFYPKFEQTVKDCYIRVAIGTEPGTNEPAYRMAKIEGIIEKEDKPYAIEGANGKNFVTSQYVLASIGKAKRDYPFIFCSMSRFTEREFTRYKSVMMTERLPLPTRKFIDTKIDEINRLVNHTFTPQELQEKLERSGVLRQKAKAIERQTLLVSRQKAEGAGDADALENIDAALKALEGPKLAFGTTLHKVGPAPPAAAAAAPAQPRAKTQQERLADLNAANRRANAENVRRALVAEQRALQAHRRAVERGEALADPFARVKILAKTHFDVNAPGGAVPRPRAATPVGAAKPDGNGAPAVKKEEEPEDPAAALKVELKNATFDWADYDQLAAFAQACRGRNGERGAVFRRKPCVHEILASYDFGLDDLVRPPEAVQDGDKMIA